MPTVLTEDQRAGVRAEVRDELARQHAQESRAIVSARQEWMSIGDGAPVAVQRNLRQEWTHWQAIATGFNLPVAAILEAVWPCFWRRAAARCGLVALHFGDQGDYQHNTFYSRHPVPAFPWQVPALHQIIMLKSASIAQGDPHRGDWRYALALCEKTLDADIEHWLAGMDATSSFVREEWLGSWADAPEPVALLDGLLEQRMHVAETDPPAW